MELIIEANSRQSCFFILLVGFRKLVFVIHGSDLSGVKLSLSFLNIFASCTDPVFGLHAGPGWDCLFLSSSEWVSTFHLKLGKWATYKWHPVIQFISCLWLSASQAHKITCLSSTFWKVDLAIARLWFSQGSFSASPPWNILNSITEIIEC